MKVKKIVILLLILGISLSSLCSSYTEGQEYLEEVRIGPSENEYKSALDIYNNYLKIAGENNTSQIYGFDYSKPAPIYDQSSLIKFTSISTGKLGGMALDMEGKVWIWGYGIDGRLGDNVKQGYYGGIKRMEFFVKNNIKVVKIASGYETNYALDDNGSIYVWGRGLEGQMGDGTNSLSNPNPKKVNIKEKVVDFNPAKANQVHHIAAIDVNGDLWMWGYGDLGSIPESNSYNSSPIKVKTPENVEFTKVLPGDNYTLALAKDGTVWSMGYGAFGCLGTGSLETTKTFSIIPSLSNIEEIDCNYSRNLARDKFGNVYEWGQIFGRATGTGTYVIIKTPEKLEINSEDIKLVGYEPRATKIAAGENISFFIDQFGRSWAWGSNRYFSLARDGGYEAANTIQYTDARLYPRINGDGDTQIFDYSKKFPVYVTDDSKDLKANDKKGYGFNNLHPTVYDEKYMLKNQQGEVLSIEGEVLSYNKMDGYYYIKGTDKKSTPAIDPKETWIQFAFKQPGYFKDISVERSSAIFLDVSGNIFKTSNDGSGSIAWGWDYNKAYDLNGSLETGLYDRYTYELMYMRGLPPMPRTSIKFEEPVGKIYKGSGEDKLVFRVEVDIPDRIIDEKLNLDIEPSFKSMEYILIPYDTSNPDSYRFVRRNKSLSNSEFEELRNKGYEIGNVQINDSDGSAKIGELSISDNCIVVIKVVADVYGSESIDIRACAVDNFYTPVSVLHCGLGNASQLSDYGGTDSMLVYDYTDENIKKLNRDDMVPIGLPLDSKGKVIDKIPDGSGGVIYGEPRYGYDKISIRSYEADSFIDNGWYLLDDNKIKDKGSIEIEEILDSKYNDTEAVNNKVLKYSFSYLCNERLLSKVEAKAIEVDNPTFLDRHYVYIKAVNLNGRPGRFYVFNKVYSEGPEDLKKPIDALDHDNLIGIFESDENGEIDTRTNSKFYESLKAIYGGLDNGKIEKIDGFENGSYPIDIIFQEGEITDKLIFGPNQKLLSLKDSAVVKNYLILDQSYLDIYEVYNDKVVIKVEKGSAINILDKNHRCISQAAGTGDKQIVALRETQSKGSLLRIVVEKSGKQVSTIDIIVE